MKYILLIYGEENNNMSEADQMAELQAYNVFTDEVVRRGLLVSADALHPINTATTVRVRDGKTLTTDGPFAETKEQLGGYYVLDCRDLDEAIEMAAKIPSVLHGSVEIRPLMIFESSDENAMDTTTAS
ncbi:MAG: YciI family protein [Anaerolineae bacterium]|jgi:hypothetical protein|nr:YciI family protein [Anaerolineae bacterium]